MNEREEFETWMRGCEGYPFAHQFANLMWKAWQARASLSMPEHDAASLRMIATWLDRDGIPEAAELLRIIANKGEWK